MTGEVRKGRELLGMPVYSVQEGMRLGEVAALLLRRSDSVVSAVNISSGWTHGTWTLPFHKLRTVGIDIILVDSEAILRETLSVDAIRELDTGLSGRPVITQSGEQVGTILGFLVNTNTGAIEAYRVKPESGMLAKLAATVLDRGLEIPVSLVQSVGPNALIVSDAAARTEPAPASPAKPDPVA